MASTGWNHSRAYRHPLGRVRWIFLAWGADTGMREVRTLAPTVDQWCAEIAAFIDSGLSNVRAKASTS
jgi:hypothetical protein